MERGDSDLEDWKAEAVAIKQGSRRNQEGERPARRIRCGGKGKATGPRPWDTFSVSVQLG